MQLHTAASPRLLCPQGNPCLGHTAVAVGVRLTCWDHSTSHSFWGPSTQPAALPRAKGLPASPAVLSAWEIDLNGKHVQALTSVVL